MKCIFCNEELKNRTVDYKEFGISLGKFPAKICTKCNESFFESNTINQIQKKSKRLNLFGIKGLIE